MKQTLPIKTCCNLPVVRVIAIPKRRIVVLRVILQPRAEKVLKILYKLNFQWQCNGEIMLLFFLVVRLLPWAVLGCEDDLYKNCKERAEAGDCEVMFIDFDSIGLKT